jgi:hypothetical protein
MFVAACSVVLLAVGAWLTRDPAAALPGGGRPEAPRRALESQSIEPAPIASPPPLAIRSAEATATTEDPADPFVLPPDDTPVSEIFDPLLARARGGDARAACRLARELQRCARDSRRPRDADVEARIAGESDPRRRESMIAYLVRIEEQRERSQRVCGGLDEAQLAQAFGLQFQAAQARPELRVWFALSPALDTSMFVNDLDRWQEYRRVARPWLEAAAAEGDLTAVIALARVHGDDRRPGPPFPPFREIDDARFLTYATLLDRYGLNLPPVQRAAEEARNQLDPLALAQVDADAARLYRPESMLNDPDTSARALQRSFDAAPESGACE